MILNLESGALGANNGIPSPRIRGKIIRIISSIRP
jgi:hypothetical protein